MHHELTNLTSCGSTPWGKASTSSWCSSYSQANAYHGALQKPLGVFGAVYGDGQGSVLEMLKLAIVAVATMCPGEVH